MKIGSGLTRVFVLFTLFWLLGEDRNRIGQKGTVYLYKRLEYAHFIAKEKGVRLTAGAVDRRDELIKMCSY